MFVIDAIQERRAVKEFDGSHQIGDNELRSLLEVAMLSPTAFNLQNWRFAVIRDPKLRSEIRPHAWDQAQITDASLLIVLCADLNAWNNNPIRYWAHAPQHERDAIVPAIDSYYRNNIIVQRDEAMRSCGLAAQTLMLAAKSMGYDSCPMVGFDFDSVGRLINLPENHIITMLMAVGKATKQPRQRGGRIPYENAVVIDRFEPTQRKCYPEHHMDDVSIFRPGIYRHYKGAHYLAFGLAREDVSNDPVVVYARLHERGGLPLSTRTLKIWNELVPMGESFVQRFTYIGPVSPLEGKN